MASCSGAGSVMKGSARTPAGGVITSSRCGSTSSTMRCVSGGQQQQVSRCDRHRTVLQEICYGYSAVGKEWKDQAHRYRELCAQFG
jgi:hypothetical protein